MADSSEQTAADDAAYIIEWATRMAKANPEILHIARQWVEMIEMARPVKEEGTA